MYWTHSYYWNQKPKIERADLDGGNRRIAIQLGCLGDAYPSGLALDITKNWLYWVDRYHGQLEVYEFSTNTRREIIRSGEEAFLSNPTGLALFRDHLFWTDSSWYGIYRVDRETKGNIENVWSTQYDPASIHAYDTSVTVSPGMNSNLIIDTVIVQVMFHFEAYWPIRPAPISDFGSLKLPEVDEMLAHSMVNP